MIYFTKRGRGGVFFGKRKTYINPHSSVTKFFKVPL